MGVIVLLERLYFQLPFRRKEYQKEKNILQVCYYYNISKSYTNQFERNIIKVLTFQSQERNVRIHDPRTCKQVP